MTFRATKACFIFCKNILIFAKVYRLVPVFLCNNKLGDRRQGARSCFANDVLRNDVEAIPQIMLPSANDDAYGELATELPPYTLKQRSKQ
jgi:hypothetical protein